MDSDSEQEQMDIVIDNDDLSMGSASPQQNNTVKMANSDKSGESKEDDESRSEVTFQCTVNNFSQLKESIFSEPFYARNLPWNILVEPKTRFIPPNNSLKNLGYFLQCNRESESTNWSCYASAELRVLAQKEGCEPISKHISHVFTSKEDNWGFPYYTEWAKLTDPKNGYLKDDKLILEATVKADVPLGWRSDSKKHTGFVGLKNQGATCYMNSLLQTLFFTNKLRKAVYQMPTEGDDQAASVAFALQRVFYDLQFSNQPVDTKKLTKSFGWQRDDSFQQHDVQELFRVLLDNMEEKMKGTSVKETIPSLFQGKMISFVRCKHVFYNSSRTELFYDIQLPVKDQKDIYASFVEYTKTELLDGKNKYDAGVYGLQEAEKGVTFESFPPVLHLHLLRFQFDPATGRHVKVNDRYEFPEKLNLDMFLSTPPSTSADYTLHAVLVHSGGIHAGHYVVFINPKGDGKWCKFNDDVVSSCEKEDAIDRNYGGGGEQTSAYMLVYIRDSELADVLAPVTTENIEKQLFERLQKAKQQKVLRRREREKAHFYLSLNAYTEKALMTHKGADLVSGKGFPCFTLKVAKSASYHEAVATVAEQMGYPVGSIRLWPFLKRNNHANRPTRFYDTETVATFFETIDGGSVFVETAPPSVPVPLLPISEDGEHVLIFFKYYDIENSFLTYCGLEHVERQAKVIDLLELMWEKAGLPMGTPLSVYEEEYHNSVHPLIFDFETTLEMAIDELMDGDIIVFERIDVIPPSDGPSGLLEYYQNLLHCVEVLFCDKNVPNDPGFSLELSMKMTYNQIATAVAMHLGADPFKLQFFKNQNSYCDRPGGPLRSSYDGTLKDILLYFRSSQVKKIYFQHLPINIYEMENKRSFKCTYVNSNLQEKELELFPNRAGTVADLMLEAAKKIKFETTSGHLRLLEIACCRINQVISDCTPLEILNPGHRLSYRVEETPSDHVDMQPNEFLLSVAHFQKEPFRTFGVPFLFKVEDNESFVIVKERIQKKLNVSDHEFEKYEFAIISLNVTYITDEKNHILKKENYNINNYSTIPFYIPKCLGLGHVNQPTECSGNIRREAPIKIHN